MIFLREHYVRHRNIYKKLLHESNSLRLMLDSNDSFVSKSDRISCAAEQQYNVNTGEVESPYFHLESIQVIDILPKESIPAFRKEIKRIIEKNRKAGFIFNHIEEASLDEYKKVYNVYFDFHVATFPVKANSELGKYASGINIEMISLSPSFVGLVCRFFINNEWKERINALCVNDRKKHSYYSGMERLKIYQFRQIGKGHNPGSIYKQELLGILLEEIKYRLCKELFKEIDTVIFSINKKPIAINVFETNIDRNTSEYFWRSIGIEATFCNYLKNQDACINPVHRNNLDLDYIYRINECDKYDSRMVADDIGNRFIEYLSVVGLRNSIADKIAQVSLWIQKSQNTNLTTWIKLKARADNELMYAKRFVNEFKGREFLNPDDYMVISSINVAQNAADNLEKTVDSSKKLIEDTISVVNSNVEARNSTASYRIQKTTLYTNLFSAIAALIAIIISLLSETMKSSIISRLACMQVVQYVIYIVVIILILWVVINIVIGICQKINSWIIFHGK